VTVTMTVTVTVTMTMTVTVTVTMTMTVTVTITVTVTVISITYSGSFHTITRHFPGMLSCTRTHGQLRTVDSFVRSLPLDLKAACVDVFSVSIFLYTDSLH
jgi:hypothetical protein